MTGGVWEKTCEIRFRRRATGSSIVFLRRGSEFPVQEPRDYWESVWKRSGRAQPKPLYVFPSHVFGLTANSAARYIVVGREDAGDCRPESERGTASFTVRLRRLSHPVRDTNFIKERPAKTEGAP